MAATPPIFVRVQTTVSVAEIEDDSVYVAFNALFAHKDDPLYDQLAKLQEDMIVELTIEFTPKEST